MKTHIAKQIRRCLIIATAALALHSFLFAASPADPAGPQRPGMPNLSVPNCPDSGQVGTPAQVGSSNPGILPPCSKPYGSTYGEWSAKWWQWVNSIPVDYNPQIQNGPAVTVDCSVNQSGHVWFLAESFGGTAVRTCKDPIPHGVALFFPMVNIFFGVTGFDCIHLGSFAHVTYPFMPVNDCLSAYWSVPDLGIDPSVQGLVHSYSDLVKLVASEEDAPGPFSATIDGQSIVNLTAYRAQAPMFSITTPQCNIVGLVWPGIGPCGTGIADTYYPNGSDGYWLMLTPLTPGYHTIHMTAGSPAWLDLTYKFSVGK
jgi:hypothetical protein